MKRLNLTSIAACFIFCLATSWASAQQTFKTTKESVIGYLQYLPKNYSSNSEKYPVVIFLHGIGERGIASTDPATLETTISAVAKLGPPKHAKNGYEFPFILISPQLKNSYGSWPVWYVMEVINYVKSTLRIDEKRIHITGLSLGGGGTWSTIQDYPKLFASASALCGSSNNLSKACGIAAENLPVWAFHGDKDTTIPYSRTVNMVNAINSCSPAPNPSAKLTIYPGLGHNVWDRAYATDHTYHNPNIYEWMMSYSNRKNGSNYLPSAAAGADKSYSSTTTIYLSGSGSDSDGTISAYRWTKISGPSATITNPSSESTSVTVGSGTYIFRLTVTDNGGATDSDYIKVTVGSASTSTTTTNAAPVANAGADFSITLPSNTTSIQGSASDADGTIASYAWAKLSGGTVSMSGASSSKLSLSGLVAGDYVFRLTVKDNDGATDIDDVKLTVRASTSTNQLPIASAGTDRVIKLPVSSYAIGGTASDADGTISLYRWAQISGPVQSLSGSTSPRLTVNSPTAGVCVFRLTVTDDDGATDYDDVVVTFSYPPVANAGADLRRTSTASFTITGSGTDRDGSIKSYKWTKLSGPGITMTNTTSATFTLSALVPGTYYFRLLVTDSSGLTDYDDVQVIVP
jgi:predicted esterase